MPRSCRSSDVDAASTSYPTASAAAAGSRRGSSMVSPAVASRITASIAMASSMAETELARVKPSLA